MLKLAVKRALLGSQVPRVAQFLSPNRLVILRYHSVRDGIAALQPYIQDGITHSAATFREQMKYLAGECNPVTLDQVPDFVSGEKPIPPRAVAITFDDGYRDNYDTAAPILEDCGLRGTFYISTSAMEGRPLWIVRLHHWGYVGNKSRSEFLKASARCASSSECEREKFLAALDRANSVQDPLTMSWAEAQELIQRGHIIGSHTINHPNLTRISPQELTHEVEQSKLLIEQQLGVSIRHFSHPNPILEPHWNGTTGLACQQAGYDTAVTSTGGFITRGANAFALPRQYAVQSFTDFVWNLELALCGLIR